MHRALGIRQHLFHEEIHPLLISLPLNRFTTWSLVLLGGIIFSYLSLHDIVGYESWYLNKIKILGSTFKFLQFSPLMYFILMNMLHRNLFNLAFQLMESNCLRNTQGRYSLFLILKHYIRRSDFESTKLESIFYTDVYRVFIWISWDQWRTLNVRHVSYMQSHSQ